MKKFLKWTGIILGSVLLILIITIITILIRHDRYWFYSSGGLLSENQSKFDVVYYDLSLEIFSDEQAIAGYALVKLKTLTDGLSKIELDLIDNFDISIITDQKNNSLEFEHNDDKIWINLVEPSKQYDILELKIEYEGQPIEAIEPPWIGGFNWSEDATGANWIGVSCQGEGGKIWFPCKDHPSDKPDSVAINITIPEPYYCASNGLLRSVTKSKEGFRTYHWITHYPINNYNININIGKYELVEREYIAEDGSSMPVIFYVLPEAKSGADTLIDMAVDMLYTYRIFYGEYPFTKEKFGLVQTDYLGMEHQTINAYGNNYRYTKINGGIFDWLMLHEMGHEWWGNKLTAEDWADMWLQEGICTYGQALYYLEKVGKEGYHNYIQKEIKPLISNKKPIIPKRDATSSEVYSSDIYFKGAYFMHSLRYILGDSIFFKTLKEFASDTSFIYQNMACTDDFINLLNKNSGEDYSKFVNQFLYTTELPEIQIDSLSTNEYDISINNINFVLPMDITIDDTTKRIELCNKPVKVRSKSKPIVDQQGWFLKDIKIK